MADPTSTLTTLRPELGASFMEFDLAMDRKGFIGSRVLPVLEVAKQSGPFGKIPLEQLLQDHPGDRASGGAYDRGTWQFTKDSYATSEYGHEEPIDAREAAMYAEYFDLEVIAGERALDFVLRAYEKRVATLVFNSSTFSPTSITQEWDDPSNAKPLTDVKARVDNMWTNTGLHANALIINFRVFRSLRLVDQITDAIQSAGAGDRTLVRDITIAQLSEAFDLEHIIVAGAGKNTANEGTTAVVEPVWSDEYAMVAKIVETNDIREAGLGRTFHWGEDGSSIGATVESYRDETVRSDIIRARMDTTEKLLYLECGELLDNVTT